MVNFVYKKKIQLFLHFLGNQTQPKNTRVKPNNYPSQVKDPTRQITLTSNQNKPHREPN